MPISERILGRTGFRVSEIGIGTEHLKRVKRESVASIVREALAGGVSYIDLVWSLPILLEGIADGTEGQRERIRLTVHLGSGHQDGKYVRTRKPDECRRYFDGALNDLRTEYADIANIHYVKDTEVWKIVEQNGIIDLAAQLKESGRSRAIGISTHDTNVVKLAVETGLIDVVTFQVNMASHNLQGRNEALKMCADHGVGVVAMKPFAAGRLLECGKKVRIHRHWTGGIRVDTRIPRTLTPTRCLSYVLAQPGVCTTIPGVSNLDELRSILAYPIASQEEKDYSKPLKAFF